MTLCVGDGPVCRSSSSFPTCIPDGLLQSMTYNRCIDTVDSPDDEHKVARNMYRIEINKFVYIYIYIYIYKKLCVKFVIY